MWAVGPKEIITVSQSRLKNVRYVVFQETLPVHALNKESEC